MSRLKYGTIPLAGNVGAAPVSEDNLVPVNYSGTSTAPQPTGDEEIRRRIQEDLMAGKDTAEQLIPTGTLAGFIGDSGGIRSQQMKDIIAARQENLAGKSAAELAAEESLALGQLRQGGETALRQMRGIQGATGLRGGLAAAQQLGVVQGTEELAAQEATKRYLANEQLKRQALGELEGTVRGAEQFEVGVGGKEKAAQLGAGAGFAALTAGERKGIRQQEIAEKGSEAAAAIAASGGKK